MSYREILFYAYEGPGGETVQATAIDLASQHDARVIGLSIVPNAPIPSYVSPYIQVDVTQTYLKEARAIAQALEPRVLGAARSAGVAAEWRYAEGDLRVVLNTHARYADLVVVGQGSGEDVPVGPSINLPDDLVLTTGRPVLVVPWKGTSLPLGRAVLVAWNGSAQSTRAVHDALPVLQAAKKVCVLSVGEPNPGHIAGAEIAAHLAHHGVNVEADHTVERNNSTGATILAEAELFDADTVVCGAWGQSRFLETVLGGVTHHLLRNMNVAVLFSH
jgi:nucleotide-binding universal stress UspA family protein